MKSSTFIGIDVGTQGLRVVLMDRSGTLLSACKESFEWTDARDEQDPNVWWQLLVDALRKLCAPLSQNELSRIQAISVTSTSGTVIPVDRDFKPLHAALMYSDKRAYAEAAECAAISGKPYNASYGLPKMLWYMHSYPQMGERIHLWCHAADFLIGKLSGTWGITDYTSALKSGYDPEAGEWPGYIAQLGITPQQLPRVTAPGETVGRLAREAAELTGFPATIQVVAGMTDGCASQVASGCFKPGHWNTTIGTTLVIKGLTRRPVRDPLGRIYNHKHKDGLWMPGGASNTGADWITRDYGGRDLRELDDKAKTWVPTPWLSYALTQEGERFPFLCDEARGFDAPGLTDEQRYASRLESVAYIERLSYETIEAISGETVETVYSAGGGSASDLWLQIRSDALRKPIFKMKHVEGAVGAAMIAASAAEFGTLGDAVQAMSIIDKYVEPGGWQDHYDTYYGQFKSLLHAKGYLK